MPKSAASETGNMPATIPRRCIRISPLEARKLLDAEIKALRETAEAAVNSEVLFVLDLLEASQDDSVAALEAALTISARLAAGAGVSQRQWLQQILVRHAGHSRAVETLWQGLITLRVNGRFRLFWAAD